MAEGMRLNFSSFVDKYYMEKPFLWRHIWERSRLDKSKMAKIHTYLDVSFYAAAE